MKKKICEKIIRSLAAFNERDKIKSGVRDGGKSRLGIDFEEAILYFKVEIWLCLSS